MERLRSQFDKTQINTSDRGWQWNWRNFGHSRSSCSPRVRIRSSGSYYSQTVLCLLNLKLEYSGDFWHEKRFGFGGAHGGEVSFKIWQLDVKISKITGFFFIRHFLLVEWNILTLYSYQGRSLGSPRWKGMSQEPLYPPCISICSDTLVVRDQGNDRCKQKTLNKTFPNSLNSNKFYIKIGRLIKKFGSSQYYTSLNCRQKSPSLKFSPTIMSKTWPFWPSIILVAWRIVNLPL